ncbi:uncharacterized protein B0I36DRAFT_315577 [Microdochium trichocladiopsis]|uniref:Uncharacterized protein n=1 Tax=Microdochium trichocladiopsis TaxID=1682393 RepID=A0A9P8YFU5_9PEZI|nr:uncharacterized protein B0I36DRAFT_315577 [Microdochium trichocladiopsis]KAH7038117.1 hypothetical protein B0I36DRAFT_315577 [Microdochium trichocladiopsis]
MGGAGTVPNWPRPFGRGGVSVDVGGGSMDWSTAALCDRQAGTAHPPSRAELSFHSILTLGTRATHGDPTHICKSVSLTDPAGHADLHLEKPNCVSIFGVAFPQAARILTANRAAETPSISRTPLGDNLDRDGSTVGTIICLFVWSVRPRTKCRSRSTSRNKRACRCDNVLEEKEKEREKKSRPHRARTRRHMAGPKCLSA